MTDEVVSALGPWPKGINNRTDETTLAADELRSAINVDLTSRGNPSTRAGYTGVVSGQSMHSIWATPNWPYALVVDNGTLKAFDTNFDLLGSIRSGLKPAQYVSYALMNDSVYWSNGYDNGRLDIELRDHHFALANAGAPNLSATTGAMDVGSYQVAVTFMTSSGEESGSTMAALITLTSVGGIVVSAIPQPNDPDIMVIRIYVSTTDGDALYWLRDLPVGTTTTTIGNVPSMGKMLEHQWLSPLPPGQIVRYYNGRILVASGNVLWIGEPMRGGQMRRSQNFISFNGRITLVEPVGQGDEGGLFVAAGKRTYWLPGANPKEAQFKIAHPFGCVPGTGISVPGWYFDPAIKNECAFWMDVQGVPILGLLGGGIRPLSSIYVAPISEYGSSLFRDIDGVRSVMSNLEGAAYNNARAGDSVVATVRRNGVVI